MHLKFIQQPTQTFFAFSTPIKRLDKAEDYMKNMQMVRMVTKYNKKQEEAKQ